MSNGNGFVSAVSTKPDPFRALIHRLSQAYCILLEHDGLCFNFTHVNGRQVVRPPTKYSTECVTCV